MRARWPAVLGALTMLAVPAAFGGAAVAGADPAPVAPTTTAVTPSPPSGTPTTEAPPADSTTTTTTTRTPMPPPLDPGQQAAGITVTGEGHASAAPDRMTVTLGVSVTAPSVQAARDQAATSAQAVIQALKDAGVAPADIQTATFSIQPRYDTSQDGRGELTGYTVTNTVQTTIRDLGHAGEIIDRAVGAGGDDVVVNGVWFDVQDETALETQARQAAWQSALGKAQQLAELAGVTLGPVVDISETTTSPPSPMVNARAAGPATPIEPGQVQATVQLTVRWALGGAAPARP
jgi:uncharacterized protein YggE